MNKTTIERATDMARHQFLSTLKRADDARGDAKGKARKSVRECVTCFYFRGGVVGHAFTNYTCEGCGQDFRHPNTGVPKLCEGCADAHGACRRCGGLREWPSDSREGGEL